MKIGLAAVAVLVAAFVLTPNSPPPHDTWQAILYPTDDKRPLKSGLRLAIEGRLRWLGVI